MSKISKELDGKRLVNTERTKTWLMFHGLRHHITSGLVYESLFVPSVPIEEYTAIDEVAEGPDLGEGTCLVSNADNGIVYLVFGHPAINVRKHAIETYETFTALGFNDALVRPVPGLLLSAVPSGRPIRFDISDSPEF